MRAIYVLVLVAGCFNPTYHNPACGPGGECPSGLKCDDQQRCVASISGDARSDSSGPNDTLTDTPTDIAIDAPPTPCLDKWMAGTVTFTAPVPMTVLNANAVDVAPSLSSDGLALYFSTGRNGGGELDLYRSIRTSPTAAFGVPSRVSELSATGNDFKITFTSDDLTAVFGSDRVGGEGLADFWVTTRAAVTATWAVPSQTFVMTVNDANNQGDPELNADGTRIYFSDLAPPRIVVATRASTTANFNAQTVLISSGVGDGDPSLSADERLILFMSSRSPSQGQDLWYATRASVSAAFGTPRHLATLSSAQTEQFPELSRDGCTVYFASNRGGGNADLFEASVILP